MSSLSVVIITKNEEQNLPRCLNSVKFADEIIVIDSQSTDRTIGIAEEFGAKVYSPVWNGYGKAKREGVNRAISEWILSIDADEVLSSELTSQIKDLLSDSNSLDGYYVRRKTMFLGRWIKHCGWYPDYLLRFFRKDKGNFNSAKIHEEVILDGQTGKLDGEILHYCYDNLELYLEKSNRYTTIGAKAAFEKGKRARFFDIVIRPFVSFISHYFIRLGILDGLEGFVISILSAVAVMTKYTKLRNLQRKNGNELNN